jgi:hypothetical protein
MLVNGKDKTADKISDWSGVLAEVERQIIKSQRRLYLLKRSAKIIRSKIEDGEPWSGMVTQLHETRSATRN